ncbi:hypothetical protein EH221_04465 [bacterium]|nr:MAG: hypothetical protein EH221_04465 [bacterium]
MGNFINFTNIVSIITVIASAVSIIIAVIIIRGTIKFWEEKKGLAATEKEIAELKLEQMQKEFDLRSRYLDQTKIVTNEISGAISRNLIDDPSWLDRFMDETGATYSASVYGKRIGHFFYEKKFLAKLAVNRIDGYLRKFPNKRYCVLIDSGTTMYPIFSEIAKRIHSQNQDLWKRRVCIVTNNIPGLQFLMKKGKAEPDNDYSEVVVRCYIIPGKPLSVYAAITGSEAIKWLANLSVFLEKDVWKEQDKSVEILGFVTGNYISQNNERGRPEFFPVARGEGHVEIKQKIVEISDEILIMSPLMKYSFASVDLLNDVNGFTIKRNTLEAHQNPKAVQYEEIKIDAKKKVCHITTRRDKEHRFERFSSMLNLHLEDSVGEDNLIMPEFSVRYWIPGVKEQPHLEIEREIPHKNLREKHEQGQDIWNQRWVRRAEEDLKRKTSDFHNS